VAVGFVPQFVRGSSGALQVEGLPTALQNPLAKRFHVRRPKQISVLSETGEEKVFVESVGEASVFGFEILSRPSERLCTQKPGWSIAC
jgi:hypothetical protein